MPDSSAHAQRKRFDVTNHANHNAISLLNVTTCSLVVRASNPGQSFRCRIRQPQRGLTKEILPAGARAHVGITEPQAPVEFRTCDVLRMRAHLQTSKDGDDSASSAASTGTNRTPSLAQSPSPSLMIRDHKSCRNANANSIRSNLTLVTTERAMESKQDATGIDDAQQLNLWPAGS